LKKPNQTKTEKTESNRQRPSQTGKTEPNWKNRAKLVWTGFYSKKLNQIKTGQFEPVSILKKIRCKIFFIFFKYFWNTKTNSISYISFILYKDVHWAVFFFFVFRNIFLFFLIILYNFRLF
jgi:hypothetical protein